MWPKGSNCSFLIGISDYFEDIQKNQSSSLSDTDRIEMNKIYESLNKIINKNKKNAKFKASHNKMEGKSDGNMYETGDNIDPYSIESKVEVFFDWAQTYISMADTSNNGDVNWPQLVELFNFQKPDYAIPSNIDVTLYHANFLYKHCKEKGNELLKNRKIKNAIDMYSKAINLLEKAENGLIGDENDDVNGNEEDEKKKSTKNELAIIYCNRSAAWVYLQEYKNAVNDAVFALKYDPLLTKAWIRKGMAEQELKNYRVAYGDYQVALNQSKQSDNYYKFLKKKINQCFDQIVLLHTQNQVQSQVQNTSPHHS